MKMIHILLVALKTLKYLSTQTFTFTQGNNSSTPHINVVCYSIRYTFHERTHVNPEHS